MGTLSGGPNIITNGLILNLDAANTKSYPGSGTVWNDLSLGGNNGTLINGPTFSLANAGSVVFDGTNDYTSLTRNIFNNSLPNFSISVWFYKINDGILLGNHFHNSTWESIWTSTTLFIVNGAANSTTNRQSLSFSQTPYNVWCNLTFINSSQIGYMKVFHNGNEIATRTATVVPWNSGVIPTIGAQRQNNNAIISPINGNISQIKIYNRALSAQEVAQNFNATKSRFNL